LLKRQEERRKGEKIKEHFSGACSCDLFMSVSSIQGSIYLQDEFSEYKQLNKKKSSHKKRIIKLQYQGYITTAEQ